MHIKSRSDIPSLLGNLKLTGQGAEIGVLRGGFSVALLCGWGCRTLYSIDPWKHVDSGYTDINNLSNGAYEQCYKTACKALAPFGDRSKILRMASKDAAELFVDGQLEFVYIDANHSYEACLEDIGLWFPKVKHGGVIAGHDYLNGTLKCGEFGVKRAVDEYFSGKHVIVTLDEWPSWIVLL